MQVFCERFLRFMAGESLDPDHPEECPCASQPTLAHSITERNNKAAAIDGDSRLEPFRPAIRITAS